LLGCGWAASKKEMRKRNGGWLKEMTYNQRGQRKASINEYSA